MSETVARQRPTVDLDDFERRTRQQAPQTRRDDDPLAELARLVGEHHDPYGDVFAREAAARAPETHAGQAYDGQGRREPGFDGTRMAPPFTADFAAIEAGLRGSIPAHAAPRAGDAEPTRYSEHDPAYHQDPAYDPDQAYQEAYAGDQGDQGWFDPSRVAQPVAVRSRRPVYAMVATIAIGVIGIGVAFAYKGTSSSPREIKTITAASGPTKIQPPADAAPDRADQDAGDLGKNQLAPTKLVSREEQPVDLPRAVQDNAARDAASRGTDAASVPVPLSPGQAQNAGTASPDYSAIGGAGSNNAEPSNAAPAPAYGDQGFGIGMPAPKKVKVVSVRPDGTILPNDQPPEAAMPAPRQASSKPSNGAAPVAKASTPKSTSRVATTPKRTDLNASADNADDALAAKPTKPVHKAKPQRVASADTATQEATDAAMPKATSGGAFAVQLAAPGSEADARSATAKLLKKYGSALSGRRLGFHRAESNGRSVFRVRVSSLTKEDAVSLCEKLKASGGSCFVAKN